MNKAYVRIGWEDYPSEKTPLNEDNLNKIDAALDEVDNRVVTMDITKLDLNTANSMVKNVTFDENTGIFTITYLNGTTSKLDTKLEKIATNFNYDYNTQKLILTLVDGTTQEIDMSALITQYEFENSAYINWTVVDGKVKAEIINGSITADKLQPNFLADVTIQANNAKMSADNAKTSEQNAKQSELKAKEYVEIAGPITSSITGVNPTLANSTGAPIIHLKGYGKTEQQTYTGKNLLKNTATSHTVNGVTFTINEDGSITANGKATADTTVILNVDDFLPNHVGETYIFYLQETDKYSGNVILGINTGSSTTKSGSTSFEHTIATGERLVYMRVLNGTTVSNTFYTMACKKDGAPITDATYEPYVGGTASPNPEYPQPIIGVGDGGSLEVKTTGKNIFGGLPLAQALVNSGSTNVVLNTDAKTVGYSQNTNYADETKSVLFDNFKTNTRYTIILKGVHTASSSGNENRNTQIAVRYTDAKTHAVKAPNDGEFYLVFYTDADKTVKNIYYDYFDTDRNTLSYEQCGIFEGVITADEFEPYVETTANIPLTATLYDGDYIEYNMDGSGEEYHAMKSVVFDGSDDEAWVFTDAGKTTERFVMLMSEKIVKNTGLCSISRVSNGVEEGWNGNDFICSINEDGIAFYRVVLTGAIAGVTDVATWKAWLAQNPVTVVYELAEPTVTPLTAEQIAEFDKLRTFEGITNVTCEANVELDFFRNSQNGKAVAMIANIVKGNQNKM